MEDARRWRGKTALVTGAAKRLGAAVSLALAQRGCAVILHYHRSRDEVEEIAALIRRAGGVAWTIEADLSDPGQAEEVLGRALAIQSPVDFLINNASIFPRGTLSDISLQDVTLNVQVNALAPFQLGNNFARQGREGVIVNFLDTRILSHDKKHAAYHLSKRMLFTLTKLMALEFAPLVRVNGIAPGVILPPPGMDDAHFQKFAAANPLQRVADPGEIAKAVLYLLDAEFTTGQVLFVDGGLHLQENLYGSC